jgi:hypothetical protein
MRAAHHLRPNMDLGQPLDLERPAYRLGQLDDLL